MKRALGFGLMAAVVCAGCAKSKRTISSPASTDKQYAVTAASAPFYLFGPQQANGPDKKLKRATLLTISKKSFGYARVRLTSGEEGYVSLDDIRPAPERLVSKSSPPPKPATLNYPEPNLPPPETTPAVEPTAIGSPSP